MILKRQIKAGVLLYALLMSAVLSLLFQFYTHRLKAAYHLQKTQLLSSQSYFLAELTKTMANNKTGQVVFDKGVATYDYQSDTLNIVVMLEGQEFNYQFLKKFPTSLNDEKEKTTLSKKELPQELSDSLSKKKE